MRGTITLRCPMCGSTGLPQPERNEHGVMGLICPGCEANMSEAAATPGTREHDFIWNSTSADMRRAGYVNVSVTGDTKHCTGGAEPIGPASDVWEDPEGFLWCRMHLDYRLRFPGAYGD